jgi:hypothetical protein
VGKVARISIDPQQRNRVLVIADIEATAPIDGRTLASLSLQGITGLLFIDLKQDGKSTVPGVLADGLHYPIIRSAPSDFDVLLSNLPALTTHLVELADRFNQVFSDENVRSFKATLDNARIASERLPATFSWSISSRTTSPSLRGSRIRACLNSNSCCAKAARRHAIFATSRGASSKIPRSSSMSRTTAASRWRSEPFGLAGDCFCGYWPHGLHRLAVPKKGQTAHHLFVVRRGGIVRPGVDGRGRGCR